MTARRTLLLATVLIAATTGIAQAHPCSTDALARAATLLRFHDNGQSGQPIAIENHADTLVPIKALKGKGRFDVLEVWGHIYKANYRMHFIYMQGEASCVLMGQEILEASNPY